MTDFPRASPTKWWKATSIGRIHRSPHAMFISRVRWILSISALLTLLLLIGTVWYLTNPKRLSAMSGLLLSHVLGSHVTVANARVSWNGTLWLTGVKLQTKFGKMPTTTLFSAHQIEVHFYWFGLFRGRLRASQIVASHPTLQLIDDRDTSQWNYEGFVRSAAIAHPNRNEADRLTRLPTIILHHAIVRWGEIHHEIYRTVGQSLINAQLDSTPQSHSTYRLDMQQQSLNGKPGITLTGLYNIATREFTAKIDRLTFSHAFRRTLPAPVQHFMHQLHLHSSMKSITFRVNSTGGLHVDTTLNNVSLQIATPSRVHSHRNRRRESGNSIPSPCR